MRIKKVLIDAHILGEDYNQGSKTMLLNFLQNFDEDRFKQYKLYVASNNIDRVKSLLVNKNFEYISLISTNRWIRMVIEFPLRSIF